MYNVAKALLISGKAKAKEDILEATDEGQNTPIIWAARQIIITIINFLVLMIIFKNIAVTRYSMNHMLEVLIALGANVNYQGATGSLGSRGETGGLLKNSTALHWAVRNLHNKHFHTREMF